jgi:hypothetical protein
MSRRATPPAADSTPRSDPDNNGLTTVLSSASPKNSDFYSRLAHPQAPRRALRRRRQNLGTALH